MKVQTRAHAGQAAPPRESPSMIRTKSWLLACAAPILLAACATAVPSAPSPAVTSPPPVAEASPAKPKPALGTFGFDTAGMDKAVAPGDDFNAYANGTWVKT